MKSIRVQKKNSKILIRIPLTMALLVLFGTAFTQGRVLINEYLSWPGNACSVTSEYVELYNFGPGPVDISCYILTDGDHSITMPSGTIIQPGQFFVIAGQNILPLGCANANSAVNVNLNWNTCNCTSDPIPATGDGFMTDGGSGSEQLVLFDPSFKVTDAIVRTLSETSSPVTTSSMGGQCISRTFDLDTMNIHYEMVGESQGRANSFARRTDGGCGWLKDPQQSGGATNNTPGSSSNLDASLFITSSVTCTNTGGASVSINSGNYSEIFPMKYILARDIDSNNVYDFSDSYQYGTDSTSNTVPVNNLVPGIYKLAIETNSGCDLTDFIFNILGCGANVLDIAFTSFDLISVGGNKVKLMWDVGQRERLKSFTIEKSSDGVHYTTYANISNIHDPIFTSFFFFEVDTQPRTEYFRILLHTKDGRTIISGVKNIASIDLLPQASVYPNPFIENITILIPAMRTETIKMSIHDVFGNIVRSEQIRIRAGDNRILVRTASLPPGVYVVRWQSNFSKYTDSKRVIKISQ